ncbi:MAG: acyltransferase [Chloroflexi bacterium]|nr:MAG: acyltransferase [Chloroflexota bacterium]
MLNYNLTYPQVRESSFVKRSQALDAVRGIAIILVLIWHYLPRDGGEVPGFILSSTYLFWSGVDLFFVLSGFLIAGILLQNAGSRNYFSTFYIRRAARILPLYLLLIGAFIVLIRWGPDLLELQKLSRRHLPYWSYFTFTQNFLYAGRQMMNDPLIDVTWSLAVEEQFYIFLSLFIRNLNKKKSILVIVTIALIILAPILRFLAPNFLVAYLLPLHRADSLMLGVLLALIWQWDKGREFMCKHVGFFRWSLVILFLVVAYLTYRGVWIGDVFGHLGLALFYGNVVVLALILSGKEGRFNLLKNRVLEWFGLRSYGIYLLHKPVQLLIPFLVTWFLHDTLSPWIMVAIFLIVLFVISELSYRIVEKPIMSLGHYFKYE